MVKNTQKQRNTTVSLLGRRDVMVCKTNRIRLSMLQHAVVRAVSALRAISF